MGSPWSSTWGSGVDPTVVTRIATLEDTVHEYEIYESIGTDTTGTVTKPTHGTIILDQYPQAVDCLICKKDSVTGKPLDEIAKTVAGVDVVALSFNLAGEYVLSGTPAVAPALVYQLQLAEKYKQAELSNDVILNETEVNVNPNLDSINFNTLLDNPAYSEGRVFYDKNKKALSYYNDESDITVNIGQEVLIRVRNETGATISNGSVVYPSGFSSGEVLVGLAVASDKEKCRLIGMVTADIENNSNGYVTKLGEVADINTSSFTSGDVVYLSDTVAGGITKTKPIGSHYITRIGAVKVQDALTGSVVVDISTSEFTIEVSQDVGFSTTDKATLSYADSTSGCTVTLAPTGADYCFYQYGDKYCKVTDSLSLPDEEGLFALYYNLGTLAYVKNPTNSQIEVLIQNNPIVAYVYWNSTDNKTEYFGYELHEIGMNARTHAYLHFAFGARYLNGLAPNTIVVDGNGDIDASAQFGFNSGAIVDEDIYLAYAGIGATVGLPIAYLSGTEANPTLRVASNAGFSVLTAGTGRMAFNELSGGNYVLSEVTNGDFALCHIIAVNENDASRRLVAFVGQAQYTTLTTARAGAQTEIKNLRVVGILPQEAKAIATFVFETADNFDNGVKARVRLISTGVNYVDWRTTYLNGSGSGASGGTSSTIFNDDLFQIIDNIDGTKVAKFECAGITTGNTRTFTVPNGSGTLLLSTGLAGGQTIIGGTAASENLALSSTVNATKGSIIPDSDINFNLNDTIRTISNGGYGGILQLLRSDTTSTRYARIGARDTPGNWIDGVTVKGSGYIQLGDAAPAIKMKKITGTTASTEGEDVSVEHGIGTNKIISMTVKVVEADGYGFFPEYSFTAGYQFSTYFNGSVVYVINHATNSENILSKPFVITIFFEE